MQYDKITYMHMAVGVKPYKCYTQTLILSCYVSVY